MTVENQDGPRIILGGIVALIILLFAVSKCNAQTAQKPQLDTMACNVTCIDKYIEEKTSTGKVRYYAVYNDDKKDISELIPVTQNVMSYIRLCDENNIKPSLGIKLKNGQIQSLIRYKPKYVQK